MAVFSLQGGEASPRGCAVVCTQLVTDAADGLGFEPRLQFDGPIDSIDDRVAEHLLPVLREALSNVARHANASNVRVALAVHDDDITLTVSDDGIGVPERCSADADSATSPNEPRPSVATPPSSAQPSGGSLPHLARPGMSATTAGMTDAARLSAPKIPTTD